VQAKTDSDNKKPKSKKVVYIVTIPLAIVLWIIALVILRYIAGASGLTLALVSMFPIIILGVVILLMRVSKFKMPEGMPSSIAPARAIQLLGQYFLVHHGEPNVDIEQVHITNPHIEKGRAALLHCYVIRQNGERQTCTLPLDKGEQAILNGYINFWTDKSLAYNKEADSQFLPNVVLDPVGEVFAALPPEEKIEALSSVGKETEIARPFHVTVATPPPPPKPKAVDDEN